MDQQAINRALRGYDQNQFYNPSSMRLPTEMEVQTAQDVAMNRCKSYGYNHPSCQLASQVAANMANTFNERNGFGNPGTEMVPDEPAISGTIPHYNEPYGDTTNDFIAQFSENAPVQFPMEQPWFPHEQNGDDLSVSFSKPESFASPEVQINYPSRTPIPAKKKGVNWIPLILVVVFLIVVGVLIYIQSQKK